MKPHSYVQLYMLDYVACYKTEDLMSCSHSRATALFIESINSDCRFTAYPCESFTKFVRGECLTCGDQPCPTMGLHANKYEASTIKPRGKFYLATRKTPPFCGYAYGVAVHLSSGMQPAEGLIELSFVDSDGHTANHTTYSSDYHAGQIYKDLLISPQYMSSLTRVTVRFLENSRVWSWIWAGRIQINKIAVTDGRTGQTVYLCGNDVIINSGGSATLTGLSSEC